MEMLEYRGILDRFTAGNPAPPFLNFAMLPLDLRRIDFAYPYGAIIQQERVESLLEEHAKELGAEICRGEEVVDLHQDRDGVLVEVRSASRQFGLTAQFLAGCDGGHSDVRKQLGAAFPGLTPTIVGRMGDVKLAPGSLELLKQGVPGLGGREFGVTRTDTGNLAIVPLGSEIYRLAAIEWDQNDIEREAPMGLDELRAAVRRVIDIDVAMHDPHGSPELPTAAASWNATVRAGFSWPEMPPMCIGRMAGKVCRPASRTPAIWVGS
jgi:2-polyprenyl-6-methoxyphenol hydroxylase-like FAD-dependent oxidoreductase